MDPGFTNISQDEIDALLLRTAKDITKERTPPKEVVIPDSVFTIPKPAKEKHEWKRFDFRDPAEPLLIAFDFLQPHPWQAQTCLQLAGFLDGVPREHPTLPTSLNPLYYNLVAANGSGKDHFVISAFAVWMLTTQIRSRVVITSSSYNQLYTQTFPYIRRLAETLESKMGMKMFTVTRSPMFVKCLQTGAECNMFVSDDPGNVEGYHPFGDVPDAKMAIIINEAKSISDELYEGFDRWTGYSWYIQVSSPGGCSGRFYRDCTRSNWKQLALGSPYARRVTAYDCPHIPPLHIRWKIDDLGENHPWVLSSLLAEFSTSLESTIISDKRLDELIASPPNQYFPIPDKRWLIGLDSGAGGDESVISVFEGNKQVELAARVYKDTRQSALFFHEKLSELGLKPNDDNYTINADDGGVSRGVVDQLLDYGWSVNRILAQQQSLEKTIYGNRGSELWFNLSRILEKLILQKDPVLIEQLKLRRYQVRGGEKQYLERKSEAKTRGEKSPDRADATAFCFAFHWRYFYQTLVGKEPNKVELPEGLVDKDKLVDTWSRDERSYLLGKKNAEKKGRILPTEMLDYILQR